MLRRLMIFILIMVIASDCMPPPDYSSQSMYSENSEYYIITNSTTSKAEAINYAKRLISNGYNASVYLSDNWYYAVVIGKYDGYMAKAKKRELMANNLARNDAFFTRGDGFRRKIYPANQAGMVQKRSFNNGSYFVVIRSTPSEAEAIRRAKDLRSNYYNAEVYQSDNGYYAVVVGTYEEEIAENKRRELIYREFARKDAFKTRGNKFIRKVYPTESTVRDGYYIVLRSTPSEDEAVRRAERLVSRGYNVSVHLCDNGYYAIVYGMFEIDRAKDIKQDLIYRDIARDDAFLIPEKDVGAQVYPLY
ncbi:MAG: hypothetical protein GF353_00825 [Candidatus Lokiarchaeota archaeon]|nr:hypothetical protein [Candidatus Lokiarchaeota archaeon]